MGVRGKREGNPWACQGEGFPCGFPRSGRRLDVLICRRRPARASVLARRGAGGGPAPHSGRTRCHGAVRSLCGVCMGR